MRRTPVSVMVVICASGLLSVACDDDNPVGPEDGITVYEDPDYRGDSRRFDGNEFDLEEVRGPCGFAVPGADGDWDDCISSIRVPAGWEVTIFEDPDYRGEARTFFNDVFDLEFEPGPCGDDWDDCISSIQVRRR